MFGTISRMFNLNMGVSENSVPLNPMVLLIIIPMKNGYFIGNINPTFSGPNPYMLIEKDDFSCHARCDPADKFIPLKELFPAGSVPFESYPRWDCLTQKKTWEAPKNLGETSAKILAEQILD